MKNIIRLIVLTLILVILASCEQTTPTATLPAESPTPPPPTFTPEPPTPTPLPLAVRINDGGILLSEYEAEVQRQQASDTALGQQTTPQEISQRVLDDLIGQTLRQMQLISLASN